MIAQSPPQYMSYFITYPVFPRKYYYLNHFLNYILSRSMILILSPIFELLLLLSLISFLIDIKWVSSNRIFFANKQ
jgi:hypothetical protein